MVLQEYYGHMDYITVNNSNKVIVLWIEFHLPKCGRKARTIRKKFLNTTWVPVTACVKSFQPGKNDHQSGKKTISNCLC